MRAKLLSRLGIEVWKNIPEFESYQVSNLGNAKSLKYGKERILKKPINGNGYIQVGIYKNKKRYARTINQLMAIAFLNHKPCGHKMVVDHIDTNKLNNKLYNLQVITHRENLSKDRKGISKYTGVFLAKGRTKWRASININGKTKHLGCFVNEKDASQAYQNELKKINR
mgnify:CR=1 FL=1|tara:strand:- start:31 stop:537 length:507 start_codon:yes stop_codon:yes gene_type:complete